MTMYIPVFQTTGLDGNAPKSVSTSVHALVVPPGGGPRESWGHGNRQVGQY